MVYRNPHDRQDIFLYRYMLGMRGMYTLDHYTCEVSYITHHARYTTSPK